MLPKERESNKEQLTNVTGVACIITHKNFPEKILFVEQSDGRISIPAGHTEEGETIIQTAQREIVEEAGYSTSSLEYIVGVYIYKGKIAVVVKGEVTGEQEFEPSDEIKRSFWESPDSLYNTRSIVEESLIDWKAGKQYPLESLNILLSELD